MYRQGTPRAWLWGLPWRAWTIARKSASFSSRGELAFDLDVKGGDLTVPLDAFAELYRAQGDHLEPTPRW